MRSFVIVGQTAVANDEFRLDDLPGSSGRLDILLRCVRAALLYSHGLRPDARVYLVLRGGRVAPRVLRIAGESARFIRPDERSLALTVQKVLAAGRGIGSPTFVELRPGVALAQGDLDIALSDLSGSPLFLLEERAPDIRTVRPLSGDGTFVLGDHLGLNDEDREQLSARGAIPISVGPVSLHSDDVIAVVSNELDRREARAR